MSVFHNRVHAGKLLARRLSSQKREEDLVAAIPRGGVVIGYEISSLLKLPLVPLVIKKVPTSGQPELARGAVGPEGFHLGKKSRKIERLVAERIEKYGGLTDFSGKKIILVDDGIATGATIETAIYYLRNKGVDQITIAVPVVAKEEFERLSRLAGQVVALKIPDEFSAIGEFYEDFSQVDDSKVLQLLYKNESNSWNREPRN